MNFTELILIALGLAMDAFAVSICKGLALKKINFKNSCIVGLWFGGFQGLMPLAGYFLGKNFKKYIENVDHWVAFALLVLIGANMIKEALSKEEEKTDDSLAFKTMFLLAVATSIDALAVGITFGIIPGINVYLAVLIIGVVTFVLSVVGVKIGNVFGVKYKSKAEFAGGLILILIGLKILLEHLGVLNF